MFGDKCPQNGSKNDKMAPRTTLRCPHEGPRLERLSICKAAFAGVKRPPHTHTYPRTHSPYVFVSLSLSLSLSLYLSLSLFHSLSLPLSLCLTLPLYISLFKTIISLSLSKNKSLLSAGVTPNSKFIDPDLLDPKGYIGVRESQTPSPQTQSSKPKRNLKTKPRSRNQHPKPKTRKEPKTQNQKPKTYYTLAASTRATLGDQAFHSGPFEGYLCLVLGVVSSL